MAHSGDERLGTGIALWTLKLPGLSRDRATARNTDAERVAEVIERHGPALMRLPGVTGYALTSAPRGARPASEFGADPENSDPSFAILVNALPDADVPAAPLFLEGVPLIVNRMEQPTALPM